VKSQTNRARSVVAGVVSGAGLCQPVIETPHSDESAPSRTSASWPQLLQGSGRGGCVPTGGAGHTCTHERSDGINRSNEVAGGWKQFHLPASVGDRAWRTAIATRGRDGGAVGWGQRLETTVRSNGAKRIDESATAMECATAMLEYSARRGRLTRNRRGARTHGFEEGEVCGAVLLP
jgi:hypothetical protein